MGKNADVDAARGANQTAYRAAEDARGKVFSGAVSNENLGDGVGARIAHGGLDGIIAIENFHMGALLARLGQGAFQKSFVGSGEAGPTNVDGQHIAMEAGGIAPGAGDHALDIGVGREAEQQALMSSGRLLHAVRVQVALQTRVDYIGREHQCQFAERGAFLACRSGGGVDDHDFIGSVEEFAWDRLRHALAGEFFHGFALIFDVLTD